MLEFVPAQSVQRREEILGEILKYSTLNEKAAQDIVNRLFEAKLFVDITNTYQVLLEKAEHNFGAELELWHLSIKRIDREPIGDWRIMQEIKNAILGNECEAIELYPAESRLVDTSNQYHLYGFKVPYPKMGFPFGFTERAIIQDAKFPRAKQRPREGVGKGKSEK